MNFKTIGADWLNAKRAVFFAALASFAGMPLVHAADIPLAQQPLFLTTSVEPNLMFILDDSGSMHWEVTPEEYIYTFGGYGNRTSRGIFYIYPQSSTSDQNVSFQNCIYGSATSSCDAWRSWNNNIPPFDANNPWAAFFRSAANNVTYYNPEIRYRPWVDQDGNEWANATPSRAHHNPAMTAKGWRNLTTTNRQRACWIQSSARTNSSGSNLCRTNDMTFWPATYFQYNGGDRYQAASYTRIEIRDNGQTYSGGSQRTDCANPNECTYAEEIQNFANWYTYHRSRISAARAGIGRAFADQPAGMRVGFAAINQGESTVDGERTQTIVRGVRRFQGNDRNDFFSRLYNRDIPLQATPLRRALKDAGEYYSRSGNRGPWGATPGTNNTEEHLSCRASYTVLMTDGYGTDYGSSGPNVGGNVDNAAGTNITGPGGASYTYTPRSPFSDSHSNTLADIAMYYWKRDLRTDLANRVGTSERNPAFWQHMVTFGVGLGVFGDIDPDEAFAAIATGDSITWPNPASGSDEDPAKIDDLLHAAVNSRGGFFSAGDPETFAENLSAVLADIVDRGRASASTVAANSTRLETDTAIFQASFDGEDWAGEIQAWTLGDDGSVVTPEKWSTRGRISPNNHATRTVFSSNGSEGITFSVGSWDQLNSAQRAALIGGSGGAAVGQNRIRWVRGQNDINGMRVRAELLGAIVNSSPVVAGKGGSRFEYLPDNLGGDSYLTYVQDTKSSRAEAIYVGANDGMLHGFDAATGNELFAYIPSTVYEQLHALSGEDYGTTTNPHRYSVDGPLFVGDAYFSHGGVTKWRNILVGTLGAGGRGIFVLDVTDPNSFDESNVLFELTESDIQAMGNITGKPFVAPTKDGWKIIFGNGYNSADGTASLIVVDLNDPTATQVLTTDTLAENGMAEPALLPDARGIITHAYAGDLLGRVWKFNFTDDQSSLWVSAFGTDPFFTARDDNNRVQPITAAPTLGRNEQKGNAVMIYFGTGSYLVPADNAAGDTVQSVYALADTGTRIATADRSELMEKSINFQGASPDGGDQAVRQISNNDNTEWWTGESSKRGWYLDLQYGGTITGERVISKPLLIYDRLIFPTLITSDDPCAFGGSSWLMEVVAVGDRYPGHTILGEDGLALDAAVLSLSTPIRSGDKYYFPISTIAGDIIMMEGERPGFNDGRMSWRQLR